METIIGFLVFVAIVVISIVNNIATERKAAKKKNEKKPARTTSFDELPEATRRTLFGDGEIIVARPRQAQTEKQEQRPVPARRVPLEEARPTPKPVSARSVPVGDMPQEPRVQPTARPVQQQPLGTQTLRRQPQQQRQRTVPAAQPRKPDVRPRKTEQPRRTKPVQKPVVARKPAPALPRAQGLSALLQSTNDMVRGMVLREILGPPKAFEDF